MKIFEKNLAFGIDWKLYIQLLVVKINTQYNINWCEKLQLNHNQTEGLLNSMRDYGKNSFFRWAIIYDKFGTEIFPVTCK